MLVPAGQRAGAGLVATVTAMLLVAGCSTSAPEPFPPADTARGGAAPAGDAVGAGPEGDASNAYTPPETIPGEGEPFPNLASVPERPAVRTAQQRAGRQQGLIADRAGRRYSDEVIPLQGTTAGPPPSALATPVPPGMTPPPPAAAPAQPAPPAERFAEAPPPRAASGPLALEPSPEPERRTAPVASGPPPVPAPPDPEPAAAPPPPPVLAGQRRSSSPPAPPSEPSPAPSPSPELQRELAAANAPEPWTPQYLDRDLSDPADEMPFVTPAPPPAPAAAAQAVSARSDAPAESAPAPSPRSLAPPAPPAPDLTGGVQAVYQARLRQTRPTGAVPSAGLRPPEPVPGGYETIVVSSSGVETGSAAIAAGVAGGARVATLLFPDGSAALGVRETDILRNVAALQRERGGSLHVVGHASRRTANMPPERHREVNLEMSRERAEAVARALRRFGAGPVQIAAMGDAQPLYAETMPAGEAGNRRVEVYLVN